MNLLHQTGINTVLNSKHLFRGNTLSCRAGCSTMSLMMTITLLNLSKDLTTWLQVEENRVSADIWRSTLTVKVSNLWSRIIHSNTRVREMKELDKDPGIKDRISVTNKEASHTLLKFKNNSTRLIGLICINPLQKRQCIWASKCMYHQKKEDS